VCAHSADSLAALLVSDDVVGIADENSRGIDLVNRDAEPAGASRSAKLPSPGREVNAFCC